MQEAQWWEPLLAAVVTGILTLFDLDKTFYLPKKIPKRLRLYVWWWGFILANVLIVALAYGPTSTVKPLQEVTPILRSLMVGTGFLALIRLKVTTINWGGRDIPGGPELLYEGAKKFFYKRINRIAKDARYEETIELAEKSTVDDLGRKARLSIDQDALLSDEEKNTAKTWLLAILKDTATSDKDRCLVLANFILSGQRS